MVKIRIGFDKNLHSFKDQNDAFKWIRDKYSKIAKFIYDNQEQFVFSVLSYEQGNLESLDRFYFNGDKFIKENILS